MSTGYWNVNSNFISPSATFSSLSISNMTVANIFYTGSIIQNGTSANVLNSTQNFIATNLTSNSIIITGGSLIAIGNSNTIGSLFTTGGNVGIATTTPISTLDVAGNIRKTGYSYVNSSTLTTGSAGTVLFATGNLGLYSGRFHVNAIGGGGHSSFTIDVSGCFTEWGVFTSTPSIIVKRSQWSTSNVTNLTVCTAPNGGIYLSTFFLTCLSGVDLTVTLLENQNQNANITLNTLALTTLTPGYTQFVYPLNNTLTLEGGRGNYFNLNYAGVGINTTGGSFTLDVNGTARIATSLTTASLFSTNITSTNIVGTNITSTNLFSTNVTLTNLILTSGSFGSLSSANISVSGNITVGGNLLVNGSLISVNVTSLNVINTNISAGTLNATNVSTVNLVSTTSTDGSIRVYNNSNPVVTIDGPLATNAYLDFSQNGLRELSIYRAANTKDILFYANDFGNNILCLATTSGNIGIGNTVPNFKLDVTGTGRFTTSLTTGALFSTNITSTNIVGTNISSSNAIISNVSTGTMIASSSIGVGTVPSVTLDVNGGIASRTFSTISSQGLHLQWNRSGGGGESWIINQLGGGNANAGIVFGKSNTSNVVTEQMRISEAGNVGINNSAPIYTLDVAGIIKTGNSVASNIAGYANIVLTPLTGQGNQAEISFNNAAGYKNYIYTNAPNGMVVGGNGTLSFQTGTSAGGPATCMTLTSSGNVGINTAAPLGDLHVVMGDATSAGSPLVWDSTYSVFGQSSNGGAVGIGYHSNSGGCLVSLSPNVAWRPMSYRASNHQFVISGTVGTPPSMIINSSSNVGIGTTSPSERLHVFGSTVIQGSTGVNFSINPNIGSFASIEAFTNGNTLQLPICINAYGGNVGIGTTSPLSKFHITSGTGGSILFEPGDLAGGGGPGWQCINFNGYFSGGEQRINAAKNRWRICVDQRTTSDHMFIDSSSGICMSISAAGNVGIGMLSPTNRLDVNGNIGMYNGSSTIDIFYYPNNQTTNYWRVGVDSGSSTPVYHIYNSNNNTGVFLVWNATAWSANSDRRIKRDINILSNCLNKVLQLNPVNYNFKTDTQDTPQRIGFVAQEVREVIPEIVSSNITEEFPDGLLGLNMTEMIPFLVGALKETNVILNQQNVILNQQNVILNQQELKIKKLEDFLKSKFPNETF